MKFYACNCTNLIIQKYKIKEYNIAKLKYVQILFIANIRQKFNSYSHQGYENDFILKYVYNYNLS